MFGIIRSNSSSSNSETIHSSNSYNDEDENFGASSEVVFSDEENDSNFNSDNIFLRDDIYAREHYSNRKKWNIPEAVSIPAVNQNVVSIYDQEKYQAANEAQAHTTPNRAFQNHREYLQQLEQKTKERKKQLEPKGKEKELLEREKGFNLYLGGANRQRTSGGLTSKTMKKSRASTPTKRMPSTPQIDSNNASKEVLSARETSSSTAYKQNINPSLKFQQRRRAWKRDRVLIRAESGSRRLVAPKDDVLAELFSDVSESATRNERDFELSRKDISVLRESLSQNFPILETPQNYLEKLIEKMKQLDRKKQGHLLEYLEKLEQARDDELVSSSPDECEEYEDLPKQITFRILSNWGHDRVVGLTGIELFTKEDHEIEIAEYDVTVKGVSEQTSSIMRLFNGRTKTVEEKNMWTAQIPSLNYIDIIIKLPLDQQLSYIRIWNYNKSVNDLTKGVRELELFLDIEQIWSGVIQRGCGNNVFDYAATISVNTAPRKKSKLTKRSSEEMLPRYPVEAKTEEPTNSSRPTSAINSKTPIWLSNSMEDSVMTVEDVVENSAELEESVDADKSVLEERRKLFSAQISERRKKNIQKEVEDSELSKRLPSKQDDSIDALTQFKNTQINRLSGIEERRDTSKLKPKKDNSDIFNKTLEGQSMVSPRTVPAIQEASTNTFVNNIPSIDVSDCKIEIPTLPKGRSIIFNIISTYGDPHFIGLSGIEIFDARGRLVALKNVHKQVRADPPDINILPEYKNDPRTVDKLFDGVNATCDDFHMWLAPFTTGKPHYIYINFEEPVTISMLRVWNYNKSRIHSYRGAKYMEISFDGNYVFKGEIQKAPGILQGVEEFAECILFTTDEKVLAHIEEYDAQQNLSKEVNNVVLATPRPSTANAFGDDITLRDSFNPEIHFKKLDPLERPVTAAQKRRDFTADVPKLPIPALTEKLSSLSVKEGITNRGTSTFADSIPATHIQIDVLSSWGDVNFVGLTGIQILDENLYPLVLKTSQIRTNYSLEHAVFSSIANDYRTIDKVLDGVNLTNDDRHMWLAPITGSIIQFTIILERETPIKALKFYNYNKSLEDSFRGCKNVKILINNVCYSPMEGHTIRKAPGNSLFDYGHTIALSKTNILPNNNGFSIYTNDIREAIVKAKQSKLETPRQDYETALLPSGYVFKVHLLSTYGDLFYIGLNGIEIYDAQHQKIPLAINNLQAIPRSVQDLEENSMDVRTLDKLIDGVNNTYDDSHMWLAPYVPGEVNLLYIIFEEPVAISYIKIWNYSKTPIRGVEEIEIFADDVLIYKGFLRKAPSRSDNMQTLDFAQSIIFTNDQSILQQEKKNIFHGIREQNVAFWNQNQPLSTGNRNALTHKPNHSALRNIARPTTAVRSNQP